MSDFKRPSDGALQLEERASIEKRTVTTSQVRIVTHTETVEELVRAVLGGGSGHSHSPIGSDCDWPRAPDPNGGGVTILPVLEETLVVEKQLVLKREIRIRKQPTSER